MEASEPKLVNSILNIIGVNSLRLRGLHISLYDKSHFMTQNKLFTYSVETDN